MAGMAVYRAAPPPYADALLAELDGIEAAYLKVLAASALDNVDLNDGVGSGIVFIGYPRWAWAAAGRPAC